MTLTAELLRSIVYYDPETGVFTWIARTGTGLDGWNARWPGTPAGAVGFDGYVRISVNQRLYLAHRLAWLYMTGVWPAKQLDHRNLIKTDNRFVNLREATHADNQRHRKMHRDNTAGYKGVSFNAGRWRARIWHDGREIALGRFDTPEEAAAAYAAAAVRLHGDFAQVS